MDTENAYLTAPSGEKIWCMLGPEFGEDASMRAIMVRTLYGLNSVDVSFCNYLADCMRHFGFESCKAYHNVWFKPIVRKDDGHQYYACCLLFVDNILMIHHYGEKALEEIDHFFKTKPNLVGDPGYYLKAQLCPMTLPNGGIAWRMSASKYVQAAVVVVEAYHEREYPTRRWDKRTSGPFPSNCAPELDTNDLLDHEKSAFYQSQIGVLRWIVELGRIDIIMEVSELSSFLAMPCEGHLNAVVHLFNFLEKRHNARVVFDPNYPMIDMSSFKECDRSLFYGYLHEAIPPNAPEPRWKDVDLCMFVNSIYAGDEQTRRSRTCFLIFLNMAPIVWFSK